MNNFQIETAQNISITQNVAGIGQRILAYLIDALVMLAYMIIVSFLLIGFNASSGQEWVFVTVLGLPIFLYFLLWESLWNGQTPGKAALDLRVVKLDGSKPAFSLYLVRWLLRIVDITLTSGSVAVVTILMNGKGQRIGDLAAGTTVISEKSKINIQNTVLVDLPSNYMPVYSQVTLLEDSDVQEIKELFNNSLKNGNYKVIQALAKKVADMMKVSPEEKPVDFLKTVIKDYNFYTQQ